MASDDALITDEMVEAGAEAGFQESLLMFAGFTSRDVSVNGLSVGNYRIMRAALTAALAALRKTHAVVPRDAGADAFAPGVYAVADVLCTSEYVNAPDASFILSLAHRAFADGYSAVLAAAETKGIAPHDPTNPFAPRERPKKSIRLMTDAERRAAGLDPNGGFDGPTGAD